MSSSRRVTSYRPKVAQLTRQIGLIERRQASAISGTSRAESLEQGLDRPVEIRRGIAIDEEPPGSSQGIMCPFLEPREVTDEPAHVVRRGMWTPVCFCLSDAGQVALQEAPHLLVHLVQERESWEHGVSVTVGVAIPGNVCA